MPRAVLDMMDRRPVWAMPDWVPARLREVLPPRWDLIVIQEATDGSGDGAGRVAPSVLALAQPDLIVHSIEFDEVDGFYLLKF